jgi:hypothetical protein
MAFTAKPEVLSPRLKRGGKAFDDENLDLLSHVLDDFIRIPGTSIRFGLDGIVGFIPGIGDLIGGIASCIIIIAAWVRGVSYVTVARMVANVAIEVLVGSVPVLGDIFDIAWRANRRNYALLVGSVDEPRKHTMQSWLFLGVLCLALLGLILLPILLFAWVFDGLFHTLFGTGGHGLFGAL